MTQLKKSDQRQHVVFKEFIDTYQGQQSAVSLAEEYVSKHKDEAILAYVGILQSLADESGDRKFILIFDQFESSGKASFDFLINFITKMPSRFHILVSFKAEEPESHDKAAVMMYQDAEKILHRKGARIRTLSGLTKNDVREWIRSVKGNAPLDSKMKANCLFENLNFFYYKMAQKDLQFIRDQLGDSEYDRLVGEIKNHFIDT